MTTWLKRRPDPARRSASEYAAFHKVRARLSSTTRAFFRRFVGDGDAPCSRAAATDFHRAGRSTRHRSYLRSSSSRRIGRPASPVPARRMVYHASLAAAPLPLLWLLPTDAFAASGESSSASTTARSRPKAPCARPIKNPLARSRRYSIRRSNALTFGAAAALRIAVGFGCAAGVAANAEASAETGAARRPPLAGEADGDGAAPPSLPKSNSTSSSSSTMKSSMLP